MDECIKLEAKRQVLLYITRKCFPEIRLEYDEEKKDEINMQVATRRQEVLYYCSNDCIYDEYLCFFEECVKPEYKNWSFRKAKEKREDEYVSDY